MKTKIKIKLLLSLIAVLGLNQIVSSQTTMNTTILTIVNNRSCPVTVNWEVSDCYNCPSGSLPTPPYCSYCNSQAQTGGPTATFVIGASTTFTVDIATANLGSLTCPFFNITSTPGFDVSVGLIEIDYQLTGTFTSVSCGCSTAPYTCFSTSSSASGSIVPASCSGGGGWSMNWTNPIGGVLVTIN